MKLRASCRRLLLLAMWVTISSSLLGQGVGWSLLTSKIEREFPQVHRIQTAELASWIADGGEKPLLLDVRTSAEFDVSHLAGARRIEPGADVATLSLPKDRSIVTYCSVGYRSARLAKRLQEDGYRHVVNLEGSIFRWANEGRPLVDEQGRPTAKVHPYNHVWGLLLEKSHRATDAPAARSK